MCYPYVIPVLHKDTRLTIACAVKTVIVVVLLAMDFWNCRVSHYIHETVTMSSHDVTQNVSGRTLVGLRYWNQVRMLEAASS